MWVPLDIILTFLILFYQIYYRIDQIKEDNHCKEVGHHHHDKVTGDLILDLPESHGDEVDQKIKKNFSTPTKVSPPMDGKISAEKDA